MKVIEYKVRPVTRYIVTKYTSDYAISEDIRCSGSSENCGEFQNVGLANRAAEGLARSQLLGPIETPGEVHYQMYSHEYNETELPAQKV